SERGGDLLGDLTEADAPKLLRALEPPALESAGAAVAGEWQTPGVLGVLRSVRDDPAGEEFLAAREPEGDFLLRQRREQPPECLVARVPCDAERALRDPIQGPPNRDTGEALEELACDADHEPIPRSRQWCGPSGFRGSPSRSGHSRE